MKDSTTQFSGSL